LRRNDRWVLTALTQVQELELPADDGCLAGIDLACTVHEAAEAELPALA